MHVCVCLCVCMHARAHVCVFMDHAIFIRTLIVEQTDNQLQEVIKYNRKLPTPYYPCSSLNMFDVLF